jgi:bifunctional DNA-binding transcriptional regulator/antitoxin component of YhaV-PrlF toxin-antitoxin module
LAERIITTAKAYLTDSSKVVVIPRKLRRQLGEENTDFFVVKLDGKGRIIYEPIKKETRLLSKAHKREAAQ